MKPVIYGGMADIAAQYDAFILDLWGVLHDGCNAYSGTIEALRKLKEAGKKTVLLSNAPRRNHAVIGKLESMNITRALYTDIVTSGEATWAALKKDFSGKKIFFIGQQEKDSSIYEGIDATLVDTPEQADVMLVSGVRSFSDKPEQYNDWLKRARDRSLTFVCANPDRIVHVGAQLVVCAGTLADIYESMGGKVLWFGKPYPSVYETAFGILGRDIAKPRIAAVGDSVITDIAGASAAGIDSILVAGGIHRDELMVGSVIGKSKAAIFMEKTAFKPAGFLAEFCWSMVQRRMGS